MRQVQELGSAMEPKSEKQKNNRPVVSKRKSSFSPARLTDRISALETFWDGADAIVDAIKGLRLEQKKLSYL